MTLLASEAGKTFCSGRSRHNIDIGEDLPWVMADRPRMIQVPGNLLAKSVRNSPESSSIRVSAAIEEVYVAISVSDECRGIPAESLPHLFWKFSRIDAEKHIGDTGLGLAICKGIVEAHGGRVWAESGGLGSASPSLCLRSSRPGTSLRSQPLRHRPAPRGVERRNSYACSLQWPRA